MKIFQCGKCNSPDVFIKKSGSNTGLYCGDCGAWIKWLNKNEIVLAERQMVESKGSKVKKEIIGTINTSGCGLYLASDTDFYSDRIIDALDELLQKKTEPGEKYKITIERI